MTIREMTFEDIDAVCAIETELFPPTEVWTDNGFATHLLRADTLYLVAEDEAGVHGYAGILLIPDEGEITKIAVEKAMQGQGIGRMLLQGILDLSPDHGVHHIFLEVRKSNQTAIALYRSEGFSVIGERREYYVSPTEDAVLMRRDDASYEVRTGEGPIGEAYA